MSVIVVNIKRVKNYQVYGGRPGVLGNPFHIGKDGSRDDVIRKHLVWARERMKYDPEYRKLVLSLDGKLVGCYCSPLPCHCDNFSILIAEWSRGEIRAVC